MKDNQYYNKEFPNSFNDFLYLCRPFTEEEIMLAEKEALIKLCVALKEKELEYYADRNKYIAKYNELKDKVCANGAEEYLSCRFQVKTTLNCSVNERFNSLDKLITWFQGEKQLHDEELIVYDHHDDISVEIEELMNTWIEGERPEDLQMF